MLLNTVLLCSGPAEHGPLRRPVQPHQAPGALQAVVRQDHGGVLPAGGQREGGRPRHLPHV